MEVVRKTVPSRGSGVTKAALSELGSAPRLGVGGGIGGSETRSIAGDVDRKLSVSEMLIIMYSEYSRHSFQSMASWVKKVECMMLQFPTDSCTCPTVEGIQMVKILILPRLIPKWEISSRILYFPTS